MARKPHGSEAVVFRGGFDRMLEHRSRLAACVLLAGESGISFSRFKYLLNETDGNLGAQLRKLEDAGYVRPHKSFEGRKPTTRYDLTAFGRKRLAAHLKALEGLIKKGRPAG